jgi:tape measure domain-containing protein
MPSLKIDLVVDDKGNVVIDKMKANVQDFDRSAKTVGNTLEGWGPAMQKAALAGAAFFTADKIMQWGKEVINASLAMERVGAAMKTVAGQNTAAELKYVRDEAERLGLIVTDTSLAYAKFAASTKNTAVEGEQTRKIFTAVSEAVTAMRLTGEESNGVFLALSQMMSKGKISAEELRGQLGERLPGAFQLMSTAMGVSTQQLNKMLEEGKLLSADVLPKFAEQLHKVYGEGATDAAQGGQAAINRFNNTLTETKVILGDQLLPVLTKYLGIAKQALEVVNSLKNWEPPGWVKTIMKGTTLAVSPYTAGMEALSSGVEMWNNRGQNDSWVAKYLRNRKQEAYLASISDPTSTGYMEEQRKYAESLGAALAATPVTPRAIATHSVVDPDVAKKAAEAQRKLLADLTKDQDEAYKAWVESDRESTRQREGFLKEYDEMYTLYSDARLDDNSKALDRINLAEKDAYNRLGAIWLQSEFDYENSGKARIITHEQFEKLQTDITRKYTADRGELQDREAKRAADNAARVAQIEASLLSNIPGMKGDSLALESAAFQKQMEEYKAMHVDRRVIAAATADFNEKLLIRQGVISNDLYAGMSAGLKDLAREQITWGQVGYESVKTFAEQSRDVTSTVLFDWYKGELKDLGDYFSSFADSMVKKWIDSIASMAQNDIMTRLFDQGGTGGSLIGAAGSIIGGIGKLGDVGSSLWDWVSGGSDTASTVAESGWDIFSVLHEGGIVGRDGYSRAASSSLLAGAPRYHTGLYAGEFPAILQEGETVLTKVDAAKLGETVGGLAAAVSGLQAVAGLSAIYGAGGYAGGGGGLGEGNSTAGMFGSTRGDVAALGQALSYFGTVVGMFGGPAGSVVGMGARGAGKALSYFFGLRPGQAIDLSDMSLSDALSMVGPATSAIDWATVYVDPLGLTLADILAMVGPATGVPLSDLGFGVYDGDFGGGYGYGSGANGTAGGGYSNASGGTNGGWGSTGWGGGAGFEKGTDYVPYTGWFQLHRGEAVVPAEVNSRRGAALDPSALAEAMARALGNMTVKIYVGNEEFDGHIRKEADGVYTARAKRKNLNAEDGVY